MTTTVHPDVLNSACVLGINGHVLRNVLDGRKDRITYAARLRITAHLVHAMGIKVPAVAEMLGEDDASTYARLMHGKDRSDPAPEPRTDLTPLACRACGRVVDGKPCPRKDCPPRRYRMYCVTVSAYGSGGTKEPVR